MPTIQNTASSFRLADVLFASTLQPSDRLSAVQVREAIRVTLSRLSYVECSGVLAWEYGEHPDQAARRMAWVLSVLASMNGARYRPRRWPAVAGNIDGPRPGASSVIHRRAGRGF